MNLLELFANKDFASLKQIFTQTNPADIAAEFEKLDDKQQASILFKLIPKDLASEVFAYLSAEKQQLLVESFSDLEIATLLKELYMDDAVDFIEEMPANVVERLLKNTTLKNREIINTILLYPDHSAGSIMTIEFVDLKDQMTVLDCFARIRKIASDQETINTCYVTDEKRVLKGVVSVRDLLLAQPDAIINDIMTTQVVRVFTNTDQEEIGQLFSKYDIATMPVVDKEDRLVGIITVDDVIDVIQQENTEDMQKMAAMAPTEEPYLKTSAFTHARKRIVWLLVLMISAIITGTILAQFEHTFVLIPALVTFIPMLMDTGGNSGAQTSTLIIRGMALNEVSLKDFFRVFLKELSVSLMVGSVLGIVNFGRILIFNHDWLLALTVSLTLYITVIVAKCIGFMLPMLAKKCKLDPALMASPLITTIVDAISMTTYFLLATAIMGL